MDKIEELVNRVNNLRGLNKNEIGNLVHIKSDSENSICQVGNKYGGITQLIYGDDKVLCLYLESILNKEAKNEIF